MILFTIFFDFHSSFSDSYFVSSVTLFTNYQNLSLTLRVEKKFDKLKANLLTKLIVGSLITFYYSVAVVADSTRLNGSLWPDLRPDLWQSLITDHITLPYCLATPILLLYLSLLSRT